MSGLFQLHAADFAKGAAVAVIIAFIGGIQQGLSAHGFDLNSYDWAFIGNLAISAFIAYLGKNFVSNSDGQIVTPLGRIG